MPIPQYAQGVPRPQLVQFVCKGRCCKASYGKVSKPDWTSDGSVQIGTFTLYASVAVTYNETTTTGFASDDRQVYDRGCACVRHSLGDFLGAIGSSEL
jgi:hypothetical protein